MNTAIIGSGAWGSALALQLFYNGHDTTLWSRKDETSRLLASTLENPRLSGVALPSGITYTSDPVCLSGKRLIVMAAPSFAVRQTARRLARYIDASALLVCVTKGIESGTGLRMSQVLAQETGCCVVALSGPSHAEEVSRGMPTGVVAASPDRAAAELVQQAFMNEYLRVYTSPDIVGVELGAAVKNIIALCIGICDGMSYGDNTKALLMTRGLEETARLGLALGASRETFSGLAGMGDLIVTCTSRHSRNRCAGILIGQGLDTDEAMRRVGAVVEGYYVASSALELARRVNVEMPITEAAYDILYNGANMKDTLLSLMLRRRTSEHAHAVWGDD